MNKVANPTQIQKTLSGVNFPASKEDLITKARSSGADESIISTLEQLPSKTYQSAADVSKEVGTLEEE